MASILGAFAHPLDNASDIAARVAAAAKEGGFALPDTLQQLIGAVSAPRDPAVAASASNAGSSPKANQTAADATVQGTGSWWTRYRVPVLIGAGILAAVVVLPRLLGGRRRG